MLAQQDPKVLRQMMGYLFAHKPAAVVKCTYENFHTLFETNMFSFLGKLVNPSDTLLQICAKVPDLTPDFLRTKVMDWTGAFEPMLKVVLEAAGTAQVDRYQLENIMRMYSELMTKGAVGKEFYGRLEGHDDVEKLQQYIELYYNKTVMEPGPQASTKLWKRLEDLLYLEGIKLPIAADAWDLHIGNNVDYIRAVAKFDAIRKFPFLWQ